MESSGLWFLDFPRTSTTGARIGGPHPKSFLLSRSGGRDLRICFLRKYPNETMFDHHYLRKWLIALAKATFQTGMRFSEIFYAEVETFGRIVQFTLGRGILQEKEKKGLLDRIRKGCLIKDHFCFNWLGGWETGFLEQVLIPLKFIIKLF